MEASQVFLGGAAGRALVTWRAFATASIACLMLRVAPITEDAGRGLPLPRELGSHVAHRHLRFVINVFGHTSPGEPDPGPYRTSLNYVGRSAVMRK